MVSRYKEIAFVLIQSLQIWLTASLRTGGQRYLLSNAPAVRGHGRCVDDAGAVWTDDSLLHRSRRKESLLIVITCR